MTLGIGQSVFLHVNDPAVVDAENPLQRILSRVY